MLRILAHRGYWSDSIKRNSPEAIRMALERGYGIESDVRDYMGELVISHNIAEQTCQRAEEVFDWLHEFNDHYTFAINIKADGLKSILMDYFTKYSIKNYFLFDMSIPQMVQFKETGLKFFTRQSEVEPHPNMYEDAAGVWLDGFWSTDWITRDTIQEHISAGKEVCLVSPELHSRKDYQKFWQRLKRSDLDLNKIMLCTDHPDEAKEYFNG